MIRFVEAPLRQAFRLPPPRAREDRACRHPATLYIPPMDSLSLFGIAAVSFTLLCYAMESGSHWWTLGFVLGCIAGSAYGFLQGAWPFGVVEIVWALVSFRRWLTLKRVQSFKFREPIA